ncbi:FliM/FliN family flagellar motor C-terminal domain-containing protein [Sphingomonas sp.]|uniref:FliM/FliN family flagellar motor C-terminal domain-containing protein n=1 Tax=Sphingomonas sp. TaxID=28214 RepID=UPI001B206A48|nr:FliM/FliN family flagellar motor C-terminal domain-containing protein [Sphingomonas sp.]MBO9714806.1 FliM/FliN family flagellar motor switch protein [Sphingomonas sp.]
MKRVIDEEVKDPQSAQAQPTAAVASPTVSSKLIGNVGVELRAFLGGAEMTVAELEALGAGTVVRLDTPLNATVVLELNGVGVARGELVAVGDKFGVRLTEIVQWPG